MHFRLHDFYNVTLGLIRAHAKQQKSQPTLLAPELISAKLTEKGTEMLSACALAL